MLSPWYIPFFAQVGIPSASIPHFWMAWFLTWDAPMRRMWQFLVPSIVSFWLQRKCNRLCLINQKDIYAIHHFMLIKTLIYSKTPYSSHHSCSKLWHIKTGSFYNDLSCLIYAELPITLIWSITCLWNDNERTLGSVNKTYDYVNNVIYIFDQKLFLRAVTLLKSHCNGYFRAAHRSNSLAFVLALDTFPI